MYRVCYGISQIHPDMPDNLLIDLSEAAVEGLARINSVLLRYYPRLPGLYEFAPRYRISTRERWKDIGEILVDKWGDCKDFTAWRLAELRVQGIDVKAESIVGRKGRRLMFHTYVRYLDGRVEDPAKELGMP